MDTPQWLASWSKQRQKGRWAYVLSNGLPYGVVMFIAMTFFASRRAHLTLSYVVISALVYAAGGALFGISMWAICERRYRKLLAANPPMASDL